MRQPPFWTRRIDAGASRARGDLDLADGAGTRQTRDNATVRVIQRFWGMLGRVLAWSAFLLVFPTLRSNLKGRRVVASQVPACGGRTSEAWRFTALVECLDGLVVPTFVRVVVVWARRPDKGGQHVRELCPSAPAAGPRSMPRWFVRVGSTMRQALLLADMRQNDWKSPTNTVLGGGEVVMMQCVLQSVGTLMFVQVPERNIDDTIR